jgi:hypothetical protein
MRTMRSVLRGLPSKRYVTRLPLFSRPVTVLGTPLRVTPGSFFVGLLNGVLTLLDGSRSVASERRISANRRKRSRGRPRLLDSRAAVGAQVGGLELHFDVGAGRAEVVGEAQRLEVGSDGAQAVVNGFEGDEGSVDASI